MRKTTKCVCMGILATSLAMGMGAATAFAATPSSSDSVLDLRHYNGTVTYDKTAGKSVVTGGTNYVTPVKCQDPFQCCWSFSIIAAAETSMLTSLDKADDGKMNGTVDYEKAASGEAGAHAYAASDLSERHLAYFVFSHPRKTGIYSDQAGEGRYLYSGDTDAASIMDNGGSPVAGISVFSCGIGPVSESTAPFMNDEGYVQVKIPELDENKKLKTKMFTTYAAAKAYSDSVWTDEAVAQLNLQNPGVGYTKYDGLPKASIKGTWSLDYDLAYRTVAELTNSNILETTAGDGLDSGEIASMKKELSEGHPISIAYLSDQSVPGQVMGGNTYINTDNWAHYTYENPGVNHGVTIVGYDDNYSKDNFTHYVYKTDKQGNIVYDKDGYPVVDKETTALTTPSHDGAWIVKNSWGSLDSTNPLYEFEWGENGSGYFYLSYEDKSITGMETYEFDLSKKAQTRTEYTTAQYDISKATATSTTAMKSEYKMCNVFTNDSGKYALRDVGCLTGLAGDTVTMEIYLMDANDDATTVIEKGKPAYKQTETFDNAGFHRFSLDEAITVKKGQKVAAVQTTKRPDGTYERVFFYEVGEKYADAFNVQATVVKSYIRTVVNKGESLEYTNGAWRDWVEGSEETSIALVSDKLDTVYAPYVAAGQLTQEQLEEMKKEVGAGFAIDNFSIKLYLDAISDNGLKLVKSSWTVKSKKGGSTKIKTKGANGEVTYKSASKKVKVNAKGKVTVKKGTKVGTYKVKVTAAGNVNHTAATKVFKVKVK